MSGKHLAVGFTGTRAGMTKAQQSSVQTLLRTLQPAEVHHGDCVGSDSTFHDLVLWHTLAFIVIHPPDKVLYRAFREVSFYEGEIHEPKHYLDRNVDIVTASSVLIATPKSMTRKTGGTWHTIREAIKQGKRVIIVHPDGEYQSY